MKTDEIIRNLNYTIKKHENDRVFTGQTDISAMCKDILPKMEQLKAYEDAEEQGLLLRLPCKVGDTIYLFGFEGICKAIQVDEKDGMVFVEGEDFAIWRKFAKFGKTVFLTKEEAEQKLVEMRKE